MRMNMRKVALVLLAILLVSLPVWAMADDFRLTMRDVKMVDGKIERGTLLVNGQDKLGDFTINEIFEMVAPEQGGAFVFDGRFLPLFGGSFDRVIFELEGENEVSAQTAQICFGCPFPLIIEGDGSLVCISAGDCALSVRKEVEIKSGTVTIEAKEFAIADLTDLVGYAAVEPVIADGMHKVTMTTKKIVVTDRHSWTKYKANGNNTHTLICEYDNSHKGEIESCFGGMAANGQRAVCEGCGAEYGEMLPVPPQTGDYSNLMAWLAMACMSMAGVAALHAKRKAA